MIRIITKPYLYLIKKNQKPSTPSIEIDFIHLRGKSNRPTSEKEKIKRPTSQKEQIKKTHITKKRRSNRPTSESSERDLDKIVLGRSISGRESARGQGGGISLLIRIFCGHHSFALHLLLLLLPRSPREPDDRMVFTFGCEPESPNVRLWSNLIGPHSVMKVLLAGVVGPSQCFPSLDGLLDGQYQYSLH